MSQENVDLARQYLVVRVRIFLDPEAAFKAAGLSE
jgi:hypothetical protein